MKGKIRFTLGKKMVAQCEEDCVVHAGIQVLCVLASTRKRGGLCGA